MQKTKAQQDLIREVAKSILMTLEGQRFADWYADTGDFGNYITRENLETLKTEDEIVKQIVFMFDLQSVI